MAKQTFCSGWAVTLTGDSIGGKHKTPKLFSTFEKAKEYAWRMTLNLSPGEKSYYKLKYKVSKSNISFEDWKAQVNIVCQQLVGITSDSFQDFDYYEAWKKGVPPERCAKRAIGSAMLDMGL